ncbi:c-type cytochrome [Deinococcus deserti]|uniref:Putative Cytochrome c n=1 Tax=Deinococcus deserti (strain DSM 17065 / CIP 109153 / LMG 22923 / VCD115) TaxID=546414 RepID=C1CVK2_DEIDV|nr:c-type cytochrome [Deinococcus deserti]ACO46219.1 putative Cytochrome c precursor [Deinococcus deserti VCD115]
MKNTFAVSMTLLVALTLGGSFAAFQRAITPHQAEAGHGGTEGAAGEGHGGGEAGEGMTGTKGDDVVTDQEAAVNAGAGDPPAAPGGTGPEVVQDRDVSKLQNNAGGPNAGVTGQAPETGTVAGAATSAPGGNPEVAPESQADDGAERSPGGVSGETDEGNRADTNSAGATGQPPAESAVAGDPKGDPVAGRSTYIASCAGCHGQEGEGGGVGPALNGADGPKAWTLDQFTAALREGRTPERELAPLMPRFSKAQLTDSDVTNIYRHIKTLN